MPTIELVPLQLAFAPQSVLFQREFYAEMCRIEGWSVRTLHEWIDSMLYERTAISKQPDALIRQGLAILRSKGDVTPALVLKDPYVLDLLGLTDRSILFSPSAPSVALHHTCCRLISLPSMLNLLQPRV